MGRLFTALALLIYVSGCTHEWDRFEFRDDYDASGAGGRTGESGVDEKGGTDAGEGGVPDGTEGDGGEEPTACDDVICREPPDALCRGDQRIWYGDVGVCKSGRCTYPEHGETCENGCDNAACLPGGLCDPDQCNNHGICNPSDGSCDCSNPHMNDDCSRCIPGYMGYPNCDCAAVDRDCMGVCFGDSIIDCADVCDGDAQTDDCGVCNGGNEDMDCLGFCFGDAETDECGVCNGNNEDMDCLGVCFGPAEYDCDGKLCGDDGCGGQCPPGCGVGEDCNSSGRCRLSGPFLSCPGNDADCPDSDNKVSCCDSRLVPGGTFPMGRCERGVHEPGCDDYYSDGYADEVPEHAVTVSDFYLDTYEVTVGRFREFVRSFSTAEPAPGAGEHPLIPGSGWQAAWNGEIPESEEALRETLKCSADEYTWTDADSDYENHPINCVSWYEAFLFCIWDGGRLPTEAEWEYAATGGYKNRFYPWGRDTPYLPPKRANYLGNEGESRFDVGSYPAGVSRGLQHDMAGSMLEWTLDWYDADWYSGDGLSCVDCANLSSNPFDGRVRRGGCWTDEATELRNAYRSYRDPSSRSFLTGFRCARSPKPLHTVGGSASGVSAPLTLALNRDEQKLTIDADGPFTFPARPFEGRQYDVRVLAASQNCTVSDGTGDIGAGDVTDIDVSCVDLPSCEGAGPDCNDDGSAKSCCETRLVPGGNFLMGRCETGAGLPGCEDYYDQGYSKEIPEHHAAVGDYYLDTYEVTVGRFRKFVDQYEGKKPDSGEGAHPQILNSGWRDDWDAELPDTRDDLLTLIKCDQNSQTWTDAVSDQEQHPINCVNWYTASAFCIWDGGRLPTEAEWEHAAANGEDNRPYPWGDEDPDGFPERANMVSTGTSPYVDVGSYPDGMARRGQYDMAGSVAEWVLDLYDAGWYSADGNPCDNCANLDTGTDGISRGGHWNQPDDRMRAAYREAISRATRHNGFGFRCARDP